MNSARLIPIAIAAVLAIITAVVGGTMTVLDDWYYSLQQPSWAPPDYLFGVIWTLIFGLVALAGVLGWERAPTRRDAEIMLGLFALNGFLNLLWSFLFFQAQRPDFSLWEVGALWVSIIVLIVFIARFSKASAWLLVPYAAWVSIAAALNYQVVQLNGPFG